MKPINDKRERAEAMDREAGYCEEAMKAHPVPAVMKAKADQYRTQAQQLRAEADAQEREQHTEPTTPTAGVMPERSLDACP